MSDKEYNRIIGRLQGAIYAHKGFGLPADDCDVLLDKEELVILDRHTDKESLIPIEWDEWRLSWWMADELSVSNASC